MILDFISGDFKTVLFKLYIISGLWFLVLLSMIVDLVFGIQSAKKIGEIRTSEGYRRSIEKFGWYFSMLFFSLIFDLMLPIAYFLKEPLKMVPVITLLSSVSLVFTEMKSVREKGDKKLRRKTDNSLKQIVRIIKRNPKVMDKIANVIEEREKEGKNKE